MCGGIYGKFQTNFDEILLCFATLSVHVIEFIIFLRVNRRNLILNYFLNIFNINY